MHGGRRPGAGRKPKQTSELSAELEKEKSSPPPPPSPIAGVVVDVPSQPAPVVIPVPSVSRAQVRGAIRDAVEKRIDSLVPKDMKSPLAILMEAANDAKLDWGPRIQAATSAAPFIHRRQPQAIEIQHAQPPVVIAFGVPSGAPELLGLLPAPPIEAIQQAIAETAEEDGGKDGD